MDDTTPTRGAPSRAALTAAIALLILVLALLIAHIRLVHFTCDDAYISFRYARNLTEGHGLVYNEGERVEGYTNFLWVVLLAASMKTGASAESASFAWGLFFLVATFVGSGLMARRLIGGPPVWAVIPPLLLAALGPVVLWAVAGLETAFFGAAVLWAAIVYLRRGESARGLFGAGLLFAVATLIRPEGVVFGAAAGIHLIVDDLCFRKRGVRASMGRAVALAGGFVLLTAPFLVWRLIYYGEWLPNTYYVKAGGGFRFDTGLPYLWSFQREYFLLLPLAAVGIIAGLAGVGRTEARRATTFLAVLLGAHLFAVAAEGGDYMALYRFHAPVLPIAVILVTLGFRGIRRMTMRSDGRRSRLRDGIALYALLSVAAAFTYPSLQSARGTERSEIVKPLTKMRRNTRLWVAAGEALRGMVWPDATIATTAAGAIPYVSRLTTIDQSGLSDLHTARVEWQTWLPDIPGHGKIATRSYVLSHRPDLILFHPWVAPVTGNVVAPPPYRWPGYVLRAIPIDLEPAGEDPPHYLFFALRQDRVAMSDGHGFLDPATLGDQ